MQRSSKILLYALVILALVNLSQSSSAIWNQVNATIDAYAGLTNCYVVVADSSGIRYQHGKGNATWTTFYPVASASKWITSLTTFKLIQAGYFNLSSRPQDYISWWNASDARSQITVSQLLSFTAGFGIDNVCVGDSSYTLEECAKKIYNESFQYTPGNVFYYTGNHMTVLGYMATVILNQDWNTIFNERVLQPLGIPQTSCRFFPVANPNPPGGTGDCVRRSLNQLLRAIYLENLLPANLTDVMEQDQTTSATMLYSPPKASWGETWHYCSGHWLECNQSQWSNVCATINIHSSPGKFGYYPWIDYPNDYFAIIGTKDADADTSVQLGYQIKPLIISALAEDRAGPSTSSSASPSRLPSATPSRTPSTTPSRTPSITPSRTPSTTPSRTPSITPSRTPSSSSSPASGNASSSPTRSRTPTPSRSPGSGSVGQVESFGRVSAPSVLLSFLIALPLLFW